MTAFTEVLLEQGYDSSEELIRDWSLMVALSRLEQYRAECEFFERKYNMSLEELEHLAHKQKGQEDFGQEEDIEDWEFSVQALKWWQTKAEDLHRAANI